MITFTYEKHPTENYIICKIRIGAILFTSLGLPDGDTEITSQSKEWFRKHAADLERDCDIPTKRFRLLDQFCRDCKIRDT